MRIIMTKADVQELREANIIHPTYMSYLEEEWRSLYDAFSNGKLDEKFSLREHGYMVCIEPGDNNFIPMGLQHSIIESTPEYVDLIELDDLVIYRIGFLYDNDRMMLFYSIAGSLNEEIEDWLSEQAMNS
ncbi:hypothetical protein [Ammoniphilus sp. CFH 90114]|uniref:hypothetical protein n=1 Tax=Ammoniphilus sp. CFH 90114 TaxID=2493665 RepID=UPI00100EBFC1|nr:hypothetical protein [Ammoniphilus sp. CFH 90114]RXT08857.1 hypothetical protein EIZ39_08635 [Ammoniphilus sp. CFH 90114]